MNLSAREAAMLEPIQVAPDQAFTLRQLLAVLRRDQY